MAGSGCGDERVRGRCFDARILPSYATIEKQTIAQTGIQQGGSHALTAKS